MGVFDMLKKLRGDAQTKKTDLVKQDASCISVQSSVEQAIAARGKEICLDQCLKVSFADIATLGTSFAQMIPSFRSFTMQGVGYVPVNMSAGDMLKEAGQGRVYGSHVSADGASHMTIWAKAGPTKAVMPLNPAIIMMAAMLVNIEKKLDHIQVAQLEILSFLDQDKQAEQLGNLNVLMDIQKGYKHNWDNVQYRQNYHMKALDIKQAAEKNIIFYQEQIASEIKALPAIHLDQRVKDAVARMEKMFRNYRMALHLFAFASFLEILLLGNFRDEYLNQAAARIRGYDELYQTQFSKSGDMIKKYSSESVQTQIAAGLGNASKAFGKLISSVPLVSKGPVDEWLQAGGEQLLKGNNEKAAKAMQFFAGNAETDGEIFIDSIRNVGIISNHTTDMLFDGDALYLARA